MSPARSLLLSLISGTILAQLPPQAHDQGIDLQIQAADSEACASIDAKQLTQVLTNLLLNSMAAISGKGTIDMYVLQKHESVAIEVHDTGPGIPPDRQEHLFEAFYTTRSEGTGLGLAVSRELIRGMGGTITYHDGAPGTISRSTSRRSYDQ